MLNPSVAPIVPITLNGEARKLKYGFRAFKELGLNPFKPDTIISFLGDSLGVDNAVLWVRAGLLHEYAPGGERAGQTPPTADELIDSLDVPQFSRIISDCLEAAGLKADGAEEPKPADPPPA